MQDVYIQRCWLCGGLDTVQRLLLVQYRMFWPKEVWGQYGKSLADFKQPGNARQAVQCLNHMVTDALR